MSDRLTKAKIERYRYRGGWDVRWDSKIKGLGVRLYPGGAKTFILRYRKSGKIKTMALGGCKTLTVKQAEDHAVKLKARVIDDGDPLAERQAATAAETFGDLLAYYIHDYAKIHNKTWQVDERRLKNHIPASWYGRKAADIAYNDIAALHRKVGQTAPYMANRVVEVLRKAFNIARRRGIIDRTALNPAEGIERFAEKKRKRWLTEDEARRLGTAIDREPNPYIRNALWLLLLTGARKTELLNARWDQVDWDRQVLKLPDTKSGEEQEIALSGPAIAILRAIPKVAHNKHILPGTKKGQPLVNISKAWGRIRTQAGCSDARLHDLRRTVGSWLSQSGVDLNTIKDAMRHANISTTLTYARLGAEPARKAMEDHGRRVMEIAGKVREVSP